MIFETIESRTANETITYGQPQLSSFSMNKEQWKSFAEKMYKTKTSNYKSNYTQVSKRAIGRSLVLIASRYSLRHGVANPLTNFVTSNTA